MPQESRKRSFTATHENSGRGDTHYARGDRQTKQLRRGGRGSRGDGFSGRGGRGTFQETAPALSFAGSPPLPSDFSNMLDMPPMPISQGLPFDPHDPLAAMMAMQAMGLPSTPGMPSLPQIGSPNGHQKYCRQSSLPSARLEKRERCRDYEMQGFCTRGDSCFYEHGNDHLIAPGQDGMYRLAEY